MVSIFNKQFRQEEKLFSDLRKKIKKIGKNYQKIHQDIGNICFGYNQY